MVKTLDCGIVVPEFELLSRYYVQFGQIPWGKVWTSISSQLWVKYYWSRIIALALNNLQRFISHLTKKLNIRTRKIISIIRYRSVIDLFHSPIVSFFWCKNPSEESVNRRTKYNIYFEKYLLSFLFLIEYIYVYVYTCIIIELVESSITCCQSSTEKPLFYIDMR